MIVRVVTASYHLGQYGDGISHRTTVNAAVQIAIGSGYLYFDIT